MTKVKSIIFGLFALLMLLLAPALSWGQGGHSGWGVGGIPRALEQCEEELQACLELPCATFPGDGQTGEPLAYEEPDPPDGTFIDLNTGLMWEIKLAADDSACLSDQQVARDIHCVQNLYTWTADIELPFNFNGTAKTEFLDELNGDLGGEPFAGYTDWRLPTDKELHSLVDNSVYLPAVSTELPGATAGWNPVENGDYWSSTSYAFYVGSAWIVDFATGYVTDDSKKDEYHVRAVRGP